jgi:hypothetical protein
MHASDCFVSLGVVASAIMVSLGALIADPIIGLVITLVILKISWGRGAPSRLLIGRDGRATRALMQW